MKSKYLLAAALFGASAQAPAASFNLDLTADGTSTWSTVFSDTFWEITRPFNGGQVLDGAFLFGDIPSTPQVEQFGDQIGGGLDVFPNETNFANFGTIEFADGIANGVTAITGVSGITAGLTANVVVDNATDAGLGAPHTSSTSNEAGTVTLVNGQVAAINLTLDVALFSDQSA
ncbi:MAG: hypothetical protein AAF387_09165, partial [Pseudomonadota bacterium]